jgi:hypothetical protein
MKIIVPIRDTETELEFEDFQRFKKEIVEFKHKAELLKLLNYEKKQILEIDFEVSDKKELYKNEFYENLFTKDKKDRSIREDFLIITLKTIYKEEESKDSSWIYEFLVDSFLNGFSLLINISYEFALDFLRGYILGNNNEYLGKTEIVFSHLDFSYESAYNMKWPILKGVTLEQTVEWFIKHNILLNNVSNSKASRAVNAFSQMFGNLNEANSSFLFWSVLGIESLLAEGNNNVLNQIKAKCTLLFGEPTEFKKKINQLYNYRSRFIHGDIDLPPKFFYYNDKFETEYWSHLYFSVSILLALIRKLIIEDKTEFKFEYKYCS